MFACCVNPSGSAKTVGKQEAIARTSKGWKSLRELITRPEVRYMASTDDWIYKPLWYMSKSVAICEYIRERFVSDSAGRSRAWEYFGHEGATPAPNQLQSPRNTILAGSAVPSSTRPVILIQLDFASSTSKGRYCVLHLYATFLAPGSGQ